MRKFLKIFIIIYLSLMLQGCVIAITAMAIGGSAIFFAFSGSVSDVEIKEVPLAVEKMAMIIEKMNGEVTDISFTEGNISATIDKSKVKVNIEKNKDDEIVIVIRAWKYLFPNTELAEKLLNAYKG